MAPKEHDSKGHRRVKCLACETEGKGDNWFHQLAVHLSSAHKINVEQYTASYPGALTISRYSSRQASKGQKKSAKGTSVKAAAAAAPVDGLCFGHATLFIRDGLGDIDQALVPAHDDRFIIDETVLEEIAMGIEDSDNVLIVGPTGSGKTTTVEELGAIINQPVKVQNLRGDIRSSAFVGKLVATVDEEGNPCTRYQAGILPQAMKRGWWLLLDELDAAPAAILFTLQRVLTHRQLVMDEDGDGKVIEAHPDFRIIATANTLGRGDDSGLYTGTNVLNEAFLDRFGTVIEHKYLGNGKHGTSLSDSDNEVQVVRGKSGLDLATTKKLISVARIVREAVDREECYCTFSTRRLIAWAGKCVRMKGNVQRAAKITFMNKLGTDDRAFVKGICQRVIGGKW